MASLGGLLGHKGDGEPGTQTLWRGLQRLDEITAIWQVMDDPCDTNDPSPERSILGEDQGKSEDLPH